MEGTQEKSIGVDDRYVGLLATQREMSRMSDARAIAKIDELREAAREAARTGDDNSSRALLHNASQIAETTYVGTDAIAEYAEFLEHHGLPELAGEYRRAHGELTDMLAGHGLPIEGYEDGLRAQNSSEGARGRDEGATQSLDSVVGEARQASGLMAGPGAQVLRLPRGRG